MIEKLQILGMNEKETKVYLYLVEYGISGASEIAKHLGFPKSTVNFLADTLWNNGYLSKSVRANTHYYEADISLLESQIEQDMSEKEKFIHEVIPMLRLMNQNVKTKPKILFFDGEENCKKAYRELLEITGTFYEF
jgi:HTH-type transcriptional regulator, sugar sensing transcriptional regulator